MRGRVGQRIDAVTQHGRPARLERTPGPHASGGVVGGQRKDQQAQAHVVIYSTCCLIFFKLSIKPGLVPDCKGMGEVLQDDHDAVVAT
jgi:hypothetical protein